MSSPSIAVAADILGGMPTRVSSAVMVGREEPLQVLHGALSATRDGDARLVVVGGEAGAGKTRLVTEFLRKADGVLALQGGCLELGQAVMPLAPLAGILRELARERGDDHAADLVGPELAGFLPGHPQVTLDPQWTGQLAMFEAFRAALSRLAEERPVVVVIEDLHWADRSTLDLLTWLARNLTGTEVLVVATYRSDEMRRSHPLRPVLAELSRLPHVERVTLEPLTDQEIAELLTAIEGGPVPPPVVQQVADRAEGNPFFAEELFACCGDEGVPLTLRDILATRIDELPEPAKEVLRIAAAAGRRVDHRLLELVAVLEPDELDAGLRAAVEAQALVPDGDGFRFRHALLQEAVHEQLLPGERSRLHRAFADALRAEPELAAGGAGAVDSELAHHALAAHDVDLAFQSLVRAGHRARDLFAYSEAQRHFEGAVDLADRVSATVAEAAPPVWELLRQAGHCALHAGDPAHGVALKRRAIAALDPVADRVLVGGLYAELSEGLWMAGRGDDAVEASDRASELLAGERTREAAEAWGWRSRLLMLLGRFDEAVAPGRLGVEIARELDARVELSRAANSLGTSLAALGHVGEGTTLLREAIEVAAEVGAGGDVVRGYINLTSMLETVANDVENAEKWAVEGLDYASRHRVRGAMTDWLRMECADVKARLGEFAEVERLLDEVHSGWVRGVTGQYYQISHARLAALRGRYDDAAAYLQRARDLAPDIRDPQAIGPQVGVRALIQLGRGELDVGDALDLLEPYVGDASTRPGLVLVARLAGAAAEVGSAEAAAVVDRIRGLVAAARAEAAPVVADNLDGWLAVLEAEAAGAQGHDDAALWQRAREAMRTRGHAEQELYCEVRRLRAQGRAGDLDSGALASALERARALGAAWHVDQLATLARAHRVRLPGVGAPSDTGTLTAREREVLALVAEGRTNREIGAALFITEKTASVHVSNILAKLGAGNRGEAAAIARSMVVE